ncbi:MAG: hypothetical protein NUW09_09760 [Deltaproteobacteria bacterium]|nr:hypothetical protein [Deltaproteobacteria bacterium]
MSQDKKETTIKGTTSWKPARILDIPAEYKNPAFVYRWCNKMKEGNIAKKKAEGWVIDNEITKKMSATLTIEDGKPLDGTMNVRELVVMKLPKEQAAARAEFYASKSDAAMADAKAHYKQQVAAATNGYQKGGTYGNIAEERN